MPGLGDGGEAAAGVGVEEGGDPAGEFRGEVGADLGEGVGGEFAPSGGELLARFARHGDGAGEEPAEAGAHGKEVGFGGGGGAGEALGGHPREGVFGRSGAVGGEAPVEDPDEEAPAGEFAEDEVEGLEFAVRDADGFADGEGAEELGGDVHGLRGVEGALERGGAPVQAVGVFIDEHHADFLVGDDFEELGDVVAGGAAHAGGVAEERLAVERMREAGVDEELQRDAATGGFVDAAIDQASIAGGEPGLEIEASGRLAHGSGRDSGKRSRWGEKLPGVGKFGIRKVCRQEMEKEAPPAVFQPFHSFGLVADCGFQCADFPPGNFSLTPPHPPPRLRALSPCATPFPSS